MHNYLFRTARVLHPYRSAEEISELLRAATSTSGRIVPEREILQAVANSKTCAWRPGEPGEQTRKPPAWPVVEEELLRSVVVEGYALYDLWEASPVRFEGDRPHTEEIIDALFPGNPLLCCGVSQSEFATAPRRESAHTLASTGPRSFLIVECDYSEKGRDEMRRRSR